MICPRFAVVFGAVVEIGGKGGVLGGAVAAGQAEQEAAPGYLVQHGTPQSPDDLAHHQCLHFLHGGRVSRWRFQQKGKETAFQGCGRFSADNGEALLELALPAFGIVQLPHYLVQTALDSGSLKISFPAVSAASRRFSRASACVW